MGLPLPGVFSSGPIGFLKKPISKRRGKLTDKNYIVEIDGGRSFRPATEEEIAAAKKTAERIDELCKVIKAAKEELDQLNEVCKHTVRYDEDGYPWIQRTCLACRHVDLI